MGQPLSLIVKATRLCNLRCSYCHDWRDGGGQRMPFRVLARLTAAALRDAEAPGVEFIWHGGEPTVLPLSFYEKALYLQARFRRRGQGVVNSLQTNGTRITDEWARFLALNDFRVSVSLDGPPPVHDRTRVYASGRGSSDDVARGIRTLRRYGIPVGVLMVVDRDALALGADALFDFFLDEGISDFGLLPATPKNQPDAQPRTTTSHYVDPTAAAAFFADVYDRWRRHGDENIRIRELRAIEDRIHGAAATVCTLAGGCLGRYYAVEPDGQVAHCDRFVGDSRYVLGNILETGFDDLERSPRLAELRAENDRALDALRACPEFAVCNGWCPHERYLAVRHDPAHRPDCCGLRRLIEHVRVSGHRPTTAAPEPATPVR